MSKTNLGKKKKVARTEKPKGVASSSSLSSSSNNHQLNNKKKKKDPAQKDFDTFRHEIFKLGLTGLDKKSRIDARYELAIKLGAKPKKWIKPIRNLGEESKQLNIKDLQEQSTRRDYGKIGEVGDNTKTHTTSSARARKRGRK